MVYNAEGEHFVPLVAHRGQVVSAAENYFKKDMICCKTDDGSFNKTILLEVVKMIEK